MLAFYTALATLASMGQQIHTYMSWTTIKLDQFDYVRANVGNPELSVAGPSVGIDIALFYVREYCPFSAVGPRLISPSEYYCYNVEAILVVSWYVSSQHTPQITRSHSH